VLLVLTIFGYLDKEELIADCCLEFGVGMPQVWEIAMLRCKLCLASWPMTCYIYSCPASFPCYGKERPHAYFETDGRLYSYRTIIYEGVPLFEGTFSQKGALLETPRKQSTDSFWRGELGWLTQGAYAEIGEGLGIISTIRFHIISARSWVGIKIGYKAIFYIHIHIYCVYLCTY
jgi:hypothetical protein